jgi:D-sedoheptulose 7-phosphate isomerase
MQNLIKQEIQKSQAMLAAALQNTALLQSAEAIALQCINSLRNKGKILFVGNGGSAADSQHLAAELVSRYRYDRPGLPGIALTTDTSALTAIGNDYSYEKVFSRQVEAIGQPGDVLIGISTSGKSANILRAFEAARNMGIVTVGFTRDVAPMMSERCDFVLNIPGTETAKIQEGHILFGHIICHLIEDALFSEYNPANQNAALQAVTA